MAEFDFVLHLYVQMGRDFSFWISCWGECTVIWGLSRIFVFSEIVLPPVLTRRPEGREYGGAGVSPRESGVTLESSGEVVRESSRDNDDDGSVGTRYYCICGPFSGAGRLLGWERKK